MRARDTREVVGGTDKQKDDPPTFGRRSSDCIVTLSCCLESVMVIDFAVGRVDVDIRVVENECTTDRNNLKKMQRKFGGPWFGVREERKSRAGLHEYCRGRASTLQRDIFRIVTNRI
jgi:hypothetical protein